VIVLDANVWVSALRPQDVNHNMSDQWLAEWTGAGNGIVVPALFLAEVSGAVSRRAGVSGLGRQVVEDILADSSIHLVAVDQVLAEAASRYAADLLLRGADAVYVALAEKLGVPLVTWDQELVTRAASVVTVQTPSI
jgi:predicted nucleic acid-binding protein